MDQFTRRLIGFGVHAGDVDGVALCRMFNRVISGQKPPSYLSSDHDPLFEYHRWQANLRILEIAPIKTVPYTPISHPFVESFLTRRCSGTRSICRESLMRSRFITTTTVFTLRSKAIRRHKPAVNRGSDNTIWKVTAGNRIAVDLSTCRWLLNCEFETHKCNIYVGRCSDFPT